MEDKQNITGIIMQPGYQNCLFEGSIICQKDGSFRGGLTDRWGNSQIEGIVKDSAGEMSFRKKYLQREDVVLYSFRKQGDIWVGGYNGTSTGIGEAQCEIYQFGPKEDWERRCANEKFSMQTAEAFSRQMIETMVNQGFLKKTKDLRTGEEMIGLTDKAMRFNGPDRN